MKLTERHETIIKLVKNLGPITSEQIAAHLGLTRAALRPDLSILTMLGILDAKPRVGYFYNEEGDRVARFAGLQTMLVKDVHSIPVVAKADDTVYDAIVSMFVNDVNALIIVRDDAILDGMVSQKDLLKSILGKPDLQKLPVSVVMTRKKNIITAYPDETVLSAAKKMIDYDVNCLPVVRSVAHDEDDSLIEVVGRISKTNIARVLVEIGSGR